MYTDKRFLIVLGIAAAIGLAFLYAALTQTDAGEVFAMAQRNLYIAYGCANLFFAVAGFFVLKVGGQKQTLLLLSILCVYLAAVGSAELYAKRTCENNGGIYRFFGHNYHGCTAGDGKTLF